MYPWILAAHNLMRWIVLILAIYSLVRIYMGLFGKKEFTETDRKAMSFYSIGLDIQLLLGLLLYFVFSPITKSAFGNMGAAMSDTTIRFFTVEHAFMMVIAVILGHLATVMVKRAAESRSKFVRAAIWETLSVVVVLIAVPWWRPLLPHLAALMSYFV